MSTLPGATCFLHSIAHKHSNFTLDARNLQHDQAARRTGDPSPAASPQATNRMSGERNLSVTYMSFVSQRELAA